MAQKYYNSAETAKLLGKSVDDIKSMLEHRELHGYRDGADWKFKVEDIDALIKQQAKPAEGAEPVGDVLLSEIELGQSDPGLSGTVIGFSEPGRPLAESDIRLADSDIQLADSKTPVPIRKKGEESKTALSELDLTLEEDLTLEDSTLAIEGKSAKAGPSDSSAVDIGADKGLDDDELVLGGSSKGSNLTLGGDSGISLVDPSDSGLSLETPLKLGSATEDSLGFNEDDLLGSSSQTVGEGSDVKVKGDDDFLLTPLEETAGADESGSGSQVIALDTEADEGAAMVGAPGGVSMAAMLDEDLSAQPAMEMGMAAPLAGAPILGAQPGALAEGVTLMQPAATSLEPPYTKWQIAGLAVCAVFLVLCGIMMYDLLRTMWSEQTVSPGSVSSWLMDTILGLFGG
ncbi:MAG: helix-turn-helix domain-containing protein [Planctomycetaceae bacterium]|nr:helix-turn-helix domain-containing protein [Planctomycetaceae bacterium]